MIFVNYSVMLAVSFKVEKYKIAIINWNYVSIGLAVSQF